MTLEEGIKMFENLGDVLDEIDGAASSTPAASDAPEQIAAKLGSNLGRFVQGPTPLSDTPEQAVLESQQKIQSRVEQLGKVIDGKIEAVIG
jgi:hypothetical protein